VNYSQLGVILATLEELQADLVSVKAAIAQIESGVQEIGSPAGGNTKWPDLNTLYMRERNLEKRIAKVNRGNSATMRPVGYL
jgi:hypothetical protein